MSQPLDVSCMRMSFIFSYLQGIENKKWFFRGAKRYHFSLYHPYILETYPFDQYNINQGKPSIGIVLRYLMNGPCRLNSIYILKKNQIAVT